MTTKEEQLGYRDLHYSERHRQYGSNNFMFDVDSIECHWQTKLPVAMIELKHGNIYSIDFMDTEFQCLQKIATALELAYQTPYFCVVYYNFNVCGNLVDGDQDYKFITHRQYYVIPLNSFATNFITEPKMLGERTYRQLISFFRGEVVNGAEFSNTKREVSLPKLLNYKVI